ncbi:MAG: class I SAM-dependent methyltransferase [Promethearchaeota archaeon]
MNDRKTNRPTIDEYFGLDAEAYAQSKWMARNQQETTGQAVSMLLNPELFTGDGDNGGALDECFREIILDLGCGTGFSSYELLENFPRVIGMDFSRDMMQNIESELQLNLVQADLRALPFRNKLFLTTISISAYNFVAEGAKNRNQIHKQISTALDDLHRVLGKKGRVVIEFYPTELEQETFLKVLKSRHFSGGMMITDPQSRKEKKFLILQKN